MAPLPPVLHLVTVDTENTIRIEIIGDLDYDTADQLLEEATAQLASRPQPVDLHLHCGGLGTVDSMGLSALLMIGRLTAAAGVCLHLDDRPPALDRLLDITGTHDYLTAGAAADAGPAQQHATEPHMAQGTGQAGGHTAPDGPT
ncbi:STAS domain-containing protein [Streptomyces sp. NPDC003832]